MVMACVMESNRWVLSGVRPNAEVATVVSAIVDDVAAISILDGMRAEEADAEMVSSGVVFRPKDFGDFERGIACSDERGDASAVEEVVIFRGLPRGFLAGASTLVDLGVCRSTCGFADIGSSSITNPSKETGV